MASIISNKYTYIIPMIIACAFYGLKSIPQNIQTAFPNGLASQATAPVDVIILGGSHAGLSAAATLYRHQHSMLIFDNQKPRNSWRTTSRVISGWEGADPDQVRAKSRKEIDATGFAKVLDKTIVKIQKTNDTLFVVTDTEGQIWYGRKLLLAMGAEFVFPEIPGYAENFPSKIFHCMFTFGFEKRGSKSVGLLAKGSLGSVKHAMMVTQDTLKFAEKLVVYTDGSAILAKEMRAALVASGLGDSVTVDDRSIKLLRDGGSGSKMILELEDGTADAQDFLVHQPTTRPPPWIVEQLQLELDVMGNIKTSGFFYQTNVGGVYAAGDCASPFKIIPNALLMGANAAAGVARELPRSVTGNGLFNLMDS